MIRSMRLWVLMAAIIAFAQMGGSALAQQARTQVAQAPAPLGTAQYSAAPDIRCDLLEVKRVSGGALSVRWRLTNTSGAAGGLAGGPAKASRYTYHWDEIYFIDPAENKKYQILKDSANNWIGSVFEGDLPAGEQRLDWAKFPAPPATSTKISITISGFAPFEDIPISQ